MLQCYVTDHDHVRDWLQALEKSRSTAASSTAAHSSETGTGTRTRIKAVVNIGRVELEMMRNLPEHRTIEPLARFQVELSTADCSFH